MKWLAILLLIAPATALWEEPVESWQFFAQGELYETPDGLLVSGNSNLLIKDGSLVRTLPNGEHVGGGILDGSALYDMQGNQVHNFANTPDFVQSGFITTGTTLQRVTPQLAEQITATTCENQAFTPKGSYGNGFIAAYDENHLSLFEGETFRWSVQTQDTHAAIVADQVYTVSTSGTVNAYPLQAQCNPEPNWTKNTFLQNEPLFVGFQENLIIAYHASPERPANGTFVEAFSANGTFAWGSQSEELHQVAIHENGILLTGNRTEIINPQTGRVEGSINRPAAYSAIGQSIYLENGLITAYNPEKIQTSQSETMTEPIENEGDVVSIPIPFMAPLIVIGLRRFYS